MFHGGICAVDAEKIFLQEGFTAIDTPHAHDFSIRAKISRILFSFRTFLSLPSGSTVFFLFPLYAKAQKLLLRLLLLRRKISLVCMVLDFDGLRDDNALLLKKEIRDLKRYHYFILHNEKMKELMDSLVPGNIAACFQCFDYLTDAVSTARGRNYRIIFAGNLQKSAFLELSDKLSGSCPEVRFIVYGAGVTEKMRSQESISYLGVHEPYLLPEILEGAFGLVWDGNSLEECAGSYGRYLKYNSPHKLSLYILSGLPVIIWKEAATAEMVLKNNIGFTISSLYEIQEKINALTDQDYLEMANNCRQLATRISKGEFLRAAINETLDAIRKPLQA
jgi:hypothetical protein